jgi:TonB-linked SusC/RagA family outer membrane protein
MHFKSGGKDPWWTLLHNTLLVMKLTAFFLLTAILHVCTPALSQRVSISGKNLSLEQIFMEISKQTDVEFIYPTALLKTARPVTLNVRQMPVEEVLKICLQDQGLGFNIRGNTIIVFKQDDPVQAKEPVIDNGATSDKGVLIKGRVVDARGLPVELASVVLARTNAGTQTDRSGSFMLKVKSLLITDSLNISFVGLKNYGMRLGGKTDLGQIVLQSADNVLDETMIIAYGTTSERFRTGDIAMVKAVDMEKMPALNVVEALAGRVAGLNVWQNGNFASSVYNIRLRGVNIIPPDNSPLSGDMVQFYSKPLIVVNGLPLAPDVVSLSGENSGLDAITTLRGAGGGHDPLYWLNPLDVESISVLKDAEATALYGSRAANGVIMITTKKGKPGKTSLNITINTGVNVQAKRLKLLNTEQYIAMRREAWDNTIRAGLPVSVTGIPGVSYRPTTINSYDLLLWDSTRYTDWQQVLLGSAPNFNAHVELSGGKGRTTYRLGAGYNNARASHPAPPGKSAFREERNTLSLNLSSRSRNNRFRLATTVSSAVSFSLQPTSNAYNYIFLAPNAPAMLDEAGNLNYAEWWTGANGSTSLLTGNPMELMMQTYRSNRFNIQAGTHLSYELFRSLVFSIGASYASGTGRQVRIVPPTSSDSTSGSSVRASVFGNSTGAALVIEPNLRYETRLGPHHFVLLAGGSYQGDKQEGHVTTARGYTSDEQMGSLAGATSYSYRDHVVERRSVSAWGRVSYHYAGKYLVDLSARRDGFSSFGPGRRYGNFGSAGLGWIFTEEPWCKKIPLLTFGKIRGSYGITGSQSVNPYTYYSTFAPVTAVYRITLPNFTFGYTANGEYDGVRSLGLTRTANSTLGWAQARSTDIGIDLYFLPGQRLKFTFQWYRKITGDQIVINPISNVTGLSGFFLDNSAAEVENRGLEGMIDYRSPVRQAGINWDIHFNMAVNRNKLLAYPGLENILSLSYYLKTGEPLIRQELWTSFLNKKLGIYQFIDSAHPAAVPYFVSNNPVFTGGIQAGISWKGFSLSMSCVFAKQEGFINMQGTGLPGNLGRTGIGNQPLSVQNNRWQSTADSTLEGAFYAGTVSNNLTMDIYWDDASYFLVKNASLTYRLPATLLHKLGMDGMSFYINAENLLLLSLSDYNGTNPEQAGLTTTQMPLRKILVTGFTINL